MNDWDSDNLTEELETRVLLLFALVVGLDVGDVVVVVVVVVAAAEDDMLESINLLLIGGVEVVDYTNIQDEWLD